MKAAWASSGWLDDLQGHLTADRTGATAGGRWSLRLREVFVEGCLASYPIIKGNFGDNRPRTQVALKRLVDLYDAWGKPAKATQCRAMLVPPSRRKYPNRQTRRQKVEAGLPFNKSPARDHR